MHNIKYYYLILLFVEDEDATSFTLDWKTDVTISKASSSSDKPACCKSSSEKVQSKLVTIFEKSQGKHQKRLA